MLEFFTENFRFFPRTSKFQGTSFRDVAEMRDVGGHQFGFLSFFLPRSTNASAFTTGQAEWVFLIFLFSSYFIEKRFQYFFHAGNQNDGCDLDGTKDDLPTGRENRIQYEGEGNFFKIKYASLVSQPISQYVMKEFQSAIQERTASFDVVEWAYQLKMRMMVWEGHRPNEVLQQRWTDYSIPK